MMIDQLFILYCIIIALIGMFNLALYLDTKRKFNFKYIYFATIYYIILIYLVGSTNPMKSIIISYLCILILTKPINVISKYMRGI